MTFRIALAATMAVFVCAALSGCGSGEQSRVAAGSFITRATDGSYSADAKALAVVSATGPWISTADASLYDSDLAHIRQQEPAVVDIHVNPPYSLTQLLVTVPAGAGYISRWNAGSLTTGEAAFDNLLSQYNASSVAPLGNSGAVYVLTFAQSLNMTALAAVFQNAGTSLTGVSPNRIVGLSDSIAVQVHPDGSRVYTFSHGEGDCAAGCISTHLWVFTVSAEGKTIGETQSGPPAS